MCRSTVPIATAAGRHACQADVAASTINWTESNVTIANSSMVGLSGDRLIRVTCAPTASTDFAIDVIGYYS